MATARKSRKNTTPALTLTVKGIRHMEMARGLAWSGVLCVDGLPVLRFENRGDGGSLYLDWKPHMAAEFREQIESQLMAMPEAGDFEPLDNALGFLWDVAVCGGDVEQARALRRAQEEGDHYAQPWPLPSVSA